MDNIGGDLFTDFFVSVFNCTPNTHKLFTPLRFALKNSKYTQIVSKISIYF